METKINEDITANNNDDEVLKMAAKIGIKHLLTKKDATKMLPVNYLGEVYLFMAFHNTPDDDGYQYIRFAKPYKKPEKVIYGIIAVAEKIGVSGYSVEKIKRMDLLN